MKNILNRIAAWFGYTRSTPGDWMTKITGKKSASRWLESETYNPDEEFEKLSTTPVLNPVLALQESVKKGEAKIREAHLMCARFGPDGKPLIDKKDLTVLKESDASFVTAPYLIESVREGLEARLSLAEATITNHSDKCREAVSQKQEAMRALRENGVGSFDSDGDTMYDPAQYTEYTPIMGGPHFKQLYLYDYLTMHARAFEAWNHNPIAKRLVKLLSQYAMGRGFKAVGKGDRAEQVQEAWDKFCKEHDIIRKTTRMWPCEYVVYGELMVDKANWQTVDPSTVWDIVCDPDNVERVYYYHQTYPTAYQQFTGKQVPGVPGAAQAKPIEFIIRQIPFDRIIHIKTECMSNEKRGRSKLFCVLGWLKRLKDIYNADVIRHWLQASFIWDDTIEGGQAEVDAHTSKYASMPPPGSVFAHNNAVQRKPMAVANASMGGQDSVAQEILCLIGSAIGIPKEHLNLIGSMGTRATALVSSEPFTKVIEEIQGDFEMLLHEMAGAAMTQYGIKDFKDDELEFVFPSVTKDTTSETVKNIMAGQTSGYISKETGANMYAAELNISTYDFEKEQEKILEEREQGLDLATTGAPIPGGRSPDAPAPGSELGKLIGMDPADLEQKPPSPIHGQGKVDIQKDMARL